MPGRGRGPRRDRPSGCPRLPAKHGSRRQWAVVTSSLSLPCATVDGNGIRSRISSAVECHRAARKAFGLMAEGFPPAVDGVVAVVRGRFWERSRVLAPRLVTRARRELLVGRKGTLPGV